MNPLKALIIDDSEILIEELRFLLNDYKQINLVGSATNLGDAIILIENKKPDVIFLDIQLQDETGFDLFNKTEVNSQIIFITAHSEFALRAFEVNALDYLLKPIQKDRLKKTIDRICTNINSDLNNNSTSKIDYSDVIYLTINRSLRFVKVALIKMIIPAGKYSLLIYKNGKKLLAVKSLLEWEQILPEKYFIRIHRSTIVNFEHVSKIIKCKNNTQKVFIEGIEEPVIMSRRYSTKLKKNHSI